MKARPIRIDGGVAYVTLTQGHEAVVDVGDVPLIEGLNWFALLDRHTVYATRNGPTDANGKRRLIYLHRVIMGDPNGLQIDHIDGDGRNNRHCNMRTVTHAQNMYNQRTSCANTSGFKGVSFKRRGGKWQANIRLGGKQHHLGLYDTPEEAHIAYCEASIRLHGEFGRIE